MHKSEPRVNSTLITMLTRYLSLEQGPLQPIEVLALSESNFEIDSILLPRIDQTPVSYVNKSDILCARVVNT